MFIHHMPNLLDFDNKKWFFKAEMKKMKRAAHYDTINLNIRKRDIFRNAFEQLAHRKADELKGRLRVKF